MTSSFVFNPSLLDKTKASSSEARVSVRTFTPETLAVSSALPTVFTPATNSFQRSEYTVSSAYNPSSSGLLTNQTGTPSQNNESETPFKKSNYTIVSTTSGTDSSINTTTSTTTDTTEENWYNPYLPANTPEQPNRLITSRNFGRGDFAWLIDDALFFGPDGGFDRIRREDPITFSPTPGEKYGVIRVGSVNSCPVNGTGDIFLGRMAELQFFVQAGGCLWINNEWGAGNEIGCGIPRDLMNAQLAAFGLSLRVAGQYGVQSVRFPPNIIVPGEDQDADRGTLVYTNGVAYMPPFLYMNLTDFILGGTPLYTMTGIQDVPGQTLTSTCVCAFEPYGQGIVVLTADSNVNAVYFYPEVLTPGSISLLEGLQQLN